MPRAALMGMMRRLEQRDDTRAPGASALDAFRGR